MANKKISDYTEALSVADDDFFEISVDLGGGSYATRKIKKSNLGLGGSPLTTKGDLYTFDSADARLGVGSDGQVLIADSAEATGLRWGTFSSSNIYNYDDSLTGNRVLNLATYSLEVQNSTASQIFKIDDSGAFALGSASSNTGGNTNVVIGDNVTNTAAGGNVLIGRNITAPTTGGTYILIGQNASSGGGSRSISIGENANSSSSGVATGYAANASGGGTVYGYSSSATGGDGVSVGPSITNTSQNGIALGRYTTLSGGRNIILNSSRAVKSLTLGGAFEVHTSNTQADALLRIRPSHDGWINSTGNFGIGTTTPDASAKLDVNSTTGGFLPPRMTTTEKNAISSPSNGLVVYDSTLSKLCVYTGSAWETVTSS